MRPMPRTTCARASRCAIATAMSRSPPSASRRMRLTRCPMRPSATWRHSPRSWTCPCMCTCHSQEMRSAALLAKALARDAQAMPAHAALRAATLGGAQALGLAERIGSITPGKAADLVAVSLRAPELAPCYDVVSHLVYAAGREHVTHVWVAGEPRLRNGALQNDAFARL